MGSAPHSTADSDEAEVDHSKSVLAFDAFEFQPDTGELWNGGVRVRLQMKPRQVLEALLARPGELVRRQQLCHTLWPDGTFVDFESGLNTAVNRLRSSLGDCAETPRYIETIPRLGYRFIYPVSTKPLLSELSKRAAAAGQSVEPISTRPLPKIEQSSPAIANEIPAFSLPRSTSIRSTILGASVAGLFGLAALLWFSHAFAKPGSVKPVHPEFRQLTFRSGTISAARFVPGSHEISYTAEWDGHKRETDLLNLDDLSTRPLTETPGRLTATSSQGDFGLISRDSNGKGQTQLLDFSPSRGSLRQLAADVRSADWSADGRRLAIVRAHGLESRVELPIDHVVYSSRGWITDLRISPRGTEAAFLEHPVRDDDGGYVRFVDDKGNTRRLTEYWTSISGLAWASLGEDIWFTASKIGPLRALYAVSKSGGLRLIADPPSSLRLMDISRDRRVLIATEDSRTTMKASLADETGETDRTKFDNSHVDDISPDGRLLLFTENATTAGRHYSVYVHDSRSRQTVRIAGGRGLAISPDANWALTIDPEDRGSLVLRQIPSGTVRTISGEGFEYQWARFLPGGSDLLVGGAYPHDHLVVARQSPGSKPVTLGQLPYLDYVAVSPDGTHLAGLSNGQTSIVDLRSGSVQRLNTDQPLLPVVWSANGTSLYAALLKECTTQIRKLEISTGASEPWRTFSISDTPGFAGLANIVAAPDASAYAYSTHLSLSRLYVVDGWG